MGLQTPGGCGALRLGFELIAEASPNARVLVGTPTWPNHPPIIRAVRLGLTEYPYYERGQGSIRFEDMVEAVDRLGQALRAEVLEDLVRLALQSVGDWGVMKDGDATFRAQGPQRILQLACFLHDFVNERFGNRFAKGGKFAASISSHEALDPCKAYSIDLVGLLVEHDHSRTRKDFADLLRLPAFVIVIAEDAEHWDGGGLYVVGKNLRLFRLAEIGEVAAQKQHVGMHRSRLGRWPC